MNAKTKKYVLWGIGIFIGFGVLGALLEEPETATTPVAQENQKEAVMWTVDAEEFELSKTPVPIWSDPNNIIAGQQLGKVNQYAKVEFIEQHANEMYCKIKTGNITGYVGCGWLKEAPQEWKDLWKL